MSAFMLVGGPKNVPLMLEQGGVRYATIFMSEGRSSGFRQNVARSIPLSQGDLSHRLKS